MLNSKLLYLALLGAAACASKQTARLSGTATIGFTLPKEMLRDLLKETNDREQQALPPGHSTLASCGLGSCRLRIGQTQVPLMSGQQQIGTADLTYETELRNTQIENLLRAIEVSRLHKGSDITSTSKEGDARIVCLSSGCQFEHRIKFDQNTEVGVAGPSLFYGPAFWAGLLNGLKR
jgi:hypothetical protein